jgi:hypothetical protein
MELENDHAQVECFECHVRPDFRNILGYSCIDCHTKPHDFGGDDCRECHRDSTGWDQIDEGAIDHYAIWDGYSYHEDVACRGCHFAGFGEELDPDCSSCHAPDDA